MSTALIPVGDLERMAQAVAASKLFGMQSPEQALALMLVAQAEGLHPATAARDYHIINGRPALKADAMLARYLNSGGKVEWHEHTDTKVAATFSHPNGGTLRIEWDIPRATKAGLAGKDNWTKYPRQMLRARVISEGIRATNPAVAVGMYTPEEVQDFEPADKKGRGSRAKPMGDAKVVEPDKDITQEMPGENSQFITADQHIAIMDALAAVPNGEARLKKQAKLERLTMIPRKDYQRTLDWITRAREVPEQA
jgi:hypothetical protein